jgi:protoporphyrinogen oxidase
MKVDDEPVVIVGAGFTGLAVAYELAMAGRRCMLFESEATLGGLAGSFAIGDRYLERFYHHWFSSDRDIFDLCTELGCADLVQQHDAKTGVYHANSIYRLSRPMDVLRFTPLPFIDRLRLGLTALRAQRVRHWRDLEAFTAEEWLVLLGGRRAFDVVWKPLLEGKFGDHACEVGATWMWTKLHLRGGSRSKSGREVLYYLRGGCQSLLKAWVPRLVELGVEIHTDSPVTDITIGEYGVAGVHVEDRFYPSREVVVTTAPSLLAGMLAGAEADHPGVPALRRQLGAIRYLANICLVLETDRSLSDTYWLNVTDPSFPYVGVIEHTNLDDLGNYGGRHVVYLSKYLPRQAELYRMSDEEVFTFSLPHLCRMFPDFHSSWVQTYHVWRADYAQPIVTPHYSRTVPPVESPVPGLYLSSMAQVFPEDRGTNYAVRHGHRTAKLIIDRQRSRERALLAGGRQGERQWIS